MPPQRARRDGAKPLHTPEGNQPLHGLAQPRPVAVRVECRPIAESVRRGYERLGRMGERRAM
jgi:hypothetical protein